MRTLAIMRAVRIRDVLGMLAALVIAVKAGAHSDIVALRSQLLESTGASYVTARDTAFALSASEFADLLALLELAQPISQERVLASILRTRAEQPAAAVEFDQHLQQTLEHPNLRSRSGRPLYTIWFPRDRLDIDPLAFEVILKLDVPNDVRHSFTDSLSRPNPANIDRILFLAQDKGVGLTGYLAAAAEGQPEEQTRITPIIVQLHKYWREEGHISPAAVHVLASFGTQLQLDALNEIKTFEQARLPAEGFTPWNDQTSMQDLTTAYGNERHARDAIVAAQREGQQQSVLNTLTATLEQRQQQVQTAQKRLYAKGMWDQMERAITELDAQLHPSP